MGISGFLFSLLKVYVTMELYFDTNNIVLSIII